MKQKLLLMFVLLMTAVTSTMATDYITDVMLLGSGSSAGSKKQEYVAQGWRSTEYNLNKGCGSSATNIYLLYKTTSCPNNSGRPITGFYIQCGSSTRSAQQVKDGHTYIPVEGVYDDNFVKYGCNLNNNAGGNKIYLFYTKDTFDDGRAISEIWFDNAHTAGVGSNGNDDSPCDLNSGAGGSYIYMHVFYGERSNSFDYEERTWDAENRRVVTTTKTCDSFTRLTSNSNSNHTVLSDGWYVVDYDIEYQEYLDIDGDVNIILVNGKTMNAKNGIRIKTDKKLTIYGQAGNSGKIKADGSIGGKGDIYAGELIIHGGTIDCKSASHNNAAIGSGNGTKNSNAGFKAITIYGGNVTAKGVGGGAGIGSGQECNDDKQGPITIYGGTVNATGGDSAAGIGGGEESGNGPIYIYGGNVIATGGDLGPGIGAGEASHLCNDIHILGGYVEAHGGYRCDGIGCCQNYTAFHAIHNKQNKDLYVENATLIATGEEEDYDETDSGYGVNVRNLIIRNSTVQLYSEKRTAAQLNGDVTLSENSRISWGGVWQRQENRLNGFTTKKAVEVNICRNHNSTVTDNQNGTHHRACYYCLGVDEAHSYTNKNGVFTCVCGVTKNLVAKALWCQGNNTLYFVNDIVEYQSGGSYDGQTITSVNSGTNVTNTGNGMPGWGLTIRGDLQRVVFDESFATVTPQSLNSWFSDCSNLTSIEGIEYLNTSECTTMSGMFSHCSALTSIDVNGFDMSKVTSTASMFSYCENLKTIYCDNTWSGIANSSQMFSNCTSLKGGMGTVSYAAGNANDVTFANPSTGYFTNTGAVFAQALWCDGNKTLYFVHPEAPVKAGETYNGQTVTSVWSGGHVLATGDTAPGWSTVKADAQNVVFDASFAAAKPTSLVSWFSDFTSLTSADLNALDVSEVQSAASMFSGCTSLTTLYCDNAWLIPNTEGMFTDCSELKGAVSYRAAFDNGLMANPTSGYFTKKWEVEILSDGITVSNLTPYTNETVTISETGGGSGITAVRVTGQQTDSKIAVTAGGEGTWSFTMPAENVTVDEDMTITLNDGVDNSDVLVQNTDRMLNVTIDDRILYKDGSWNTLCLPFDCAKTGPLADATIKELDTNGWYDGNTRYTKVGENYVDANNEAYTGEVSALKQTGFKTDGTLYLYFKDASIIKAGVPYIVKWGTTGAPIENPTFNDVMITSTTPTTAEANNSGLNTVQFIGTYGPANLDANDKSKLYLGDGNKLYYPSSNMNINAFRGYFNVDLTGQPKGVRAFVLNFGDDVVETGISAQPTVNSQLSTVNWYTLDGRRLNGKPSRAGVYINNGKMIINK